MNNMQKLARFFIGTVAANVVLLIVIIRAYAEPFALAMDPFSWLGKMATSGGSDNTGAFLLFSAGLFFNAYKWKQVLSLLSQYGAGKHPTVRVLGQAVLAGFVLMAFPCDRFVTTHSIGAGLVVGGLWVFTTGILYRSRDRLGVGAHIGLQLVLHVAALFCGANFVLDTPLKGFSQRPLLVAIMAGTGLCLKPRNRESQ